MTKLTIDQLAFCLYFQKYLKKFLCQRIEDFSNKILPPKLCGFRKGHSTQNALLNLLKNWQKCLDKSGVVGTVLMDLSKAHDCLPHDLLLAKLFSLRL